MGHDGSAQSAGLDKTWFCSPLELYPAIALTMSGAASRACCAAASSAPKGWATTTNGSSSKFMASLMDVASLTKLDVATSTVGLPRSSNRIASSILPEVQDPQSATPVTTKSASLAISSNISSVAALEAAGLVFRITLLTP